MTIGARDLRIAVVGAGAIGGYYGAKLARAGGDVHFLMRSDLEAVRRCGIQLRERDGEEVVVRPVQGHATTAEIGPSDLVLIAVKAPANGSLLELLPPLLHERTMLLTLQNGLGNEEFLADHFGADRVLGGLCFICLNRVGPGVIEHYDRGRLAIGEHRRPSTARTRDIAEQFTRATVNCVVVEDLGLERWRKLVWNIPFNGLAVAGGGVTTDAVLHDPELRRVARALMLEVIDAANRCGFPLPQSEADVQMERTAALGAYKPSTLIDFEARRPLEIEAIWGEPLRQAAAAGARTPRLESLCATLREIDRQRS